MSIDFEFSEEEKNDLLELEKELKNDKSFSYERAEPIVKQVLVLNEIEAKAMFLESRAFLTTSSSSAVLHDFYIRRRNDCIKEVKMQRCVFRLNNRSVCLFKYIVHYVDAVQEIDTEIIANGNGDSYPDAQNMAAQNVIEELEDKYHFYWLQVSN